jgi:hypothetical protein
MVSANLRAAICDQTGTGLPKGAPLLRHLIVATFGLWLTAAAAGAQAPEHGPNVLSMLLPHEKGRALCYVSDTEPVTYPLEDHPARKPPRTVTISRFLFVLKSEKHDDDDTVTPPTPGEFYYSYRMVAGVVGKKAKLISAGECGAVEGASVFGCGSDCDGGTMAFRPVAGADALAMRVSDITRRFRMSWGCGGGGENQTGKVEVLNYDPATPAIRIERADPKVCAPMARSFRKIMTAGT